MDEMYFERKNENFIKNYNIIKQYCDEKTLILS